MLDDIIGQLVGEVAFGRLGRSRRARLLARLSFGLLGAGLGTAGAVYMLGPSFVTGNLPFRLSAVALMVSLACFSLFNIGMARPWRWPGICFAASFVGLFVARLAFGR